MNILILTQYFPPEVGAAQNRLYELSIRLVKKGAEVTILTAMPNYPAMLIHEGYKGKLFTREVQDGFTILRSWIYASKSNSFYPRILNYLSFTFSSFCAGLFSLKKQDIILCESPPLILGLSALMLSRFKRAKLVFNVSDLWPESAVKLGVVKNKMLIGLATWIEELCYKRSALITGQTQGIVDNIKGRFPGKRVYWLKNGSNPELFNYKMTSTWKEEQGYEGNDFVILYAGILGIAQGLEVILKAAVLVKSKSHIKFAIVGSGPKEYDLLRQAGEMELDNVRFFDVQPKIKMPAILAASSAVIIPLRKLPLFEGAIPSKIYESMMMAKPLLLGVTGEAKSLFIDNGRAGLAFEPENERDLADQILKLESDKSLVEELGSNGRSYVINRFSLDVIADDLWDEINELKN